MKRDEMIGVLARQITGLIAWECCHRGGWRDANNTSCACREEAQAFLDALEAAGLRIVPVEPTGEMKVAGGEAQQQSIGSWGEPGVVYRAMLDQASKKG